MRPDCPDALKLMAYMDGELTPEERAPISAHLASCPDCSSFLETQSALERSWRDSWQDPPDFRFNAMRKKLFPGGRTLRLPGWAIGLAAGAAAVFLGIRVFQPADRAGLESRIRGETDVQVIPSGPVMPDSQALIDSVAPLSGEVSEAEACEEQTVETIVIPPPTEDGRSGVGGITETEPVEMALSVAEEAIVHQPQEIGDNTGDLEGAVFAESPDDILQSQTGAGVGLVSAQSAGGGGYAAMAEETDASTVSTVSSSSAVGCCGRAASEVSLDQPDSDVSVAFTLLCERPDGAPVSPWKELSIFVDSLLQTRSSLPAMFHIDPLGFTVEQDGIPRVFLGVDDPAVVPLAVRVILH
jgi:hypothetical protein